MEKVYGSPKRQDGLFRVGRNKYEVIYKLPAMTTTTRSEVELAKAF